MHTPKSPQKAHHVEYVRPSLLSPVSFSFVLTRIKSSVFVCVCTVMIICMCRDEARQSFSWIVYMLHVIKDVRVIIDEKPYKIWLSSSTKNNSVVRFHFVLCYSPFCFVLNRFTHAFGEAIEINSRE